jgi:hypothetical protein
MGQKVRNALLGCTDAVLLAYPHRVLNVDTLLML